MKKLDYYKMRAYLYGREKNRSVEFKLNELEELWYCTQKSVKRKIKQFENDGKYKYYPGKGRGNQSFFVFNESLQEELEKDVENLIARDQLEDIIQILQLPIPKTLLTNAIQKVQKLFGLQTSNDSRDILRTIVTRKITSLDPLHTSINFETFLIHQLGDTLVTYDLESDLVQPHIAHHWEVDCESTFWTFYLRKGVRFHNQQLLTSVDVKHTFERFLMNPSPHQWLVEDVKHIECLSPYIVRFELKKSNPFFLRYVSSHNLVILPKNEPFDENSWISTGPFQLKKRSDTLLVLEAFDDYFLARPLLDEIEFYVVKYEATRAVTYKIDLDEEIKDPLHKLGPEIGFRFLAFNFKRQTIVHDHSFREAIYHLFDVKKMWNDLGRSDIKEASSYFHWKSKYPNKDMNKVYTLLKDSSYRGEVLALYTVGYPSFIEEADWLKHQALKVGIHLEIKTFTLDQLYNSSIEEADLLVMGEVASTDLHLSFIGAFLNRALLFHRFLNDKQMRQLNLYFAKMKQEIDHDKRENVIEQVENYIKEENLFLYLYHPVKKRIFHPMIHNIQFESYGYVDFRKLWFKL